MEDRTGECMSNEFESQFDMSWYDESERRPVARMCVTMTPYVTLDYDLAQPHRRVNVSFDLLLDRPTIETNEQSLEVIAEELKKQFIEQVRRHYSDKCSDCGNFRTIREVND